MKAHLIIYLTNIKDLQDLRVTFDNFTKNFVGREGKPLFIQIKDMIPFDEVGAFDIKREIEMIKHEYTAMNGINFFTT